MNVWPHKILCIAAVVSGITIDNATHWSLPRIQNLAVSIQRVPAVPVGSSIQAKVIDIIGTFVYEKELEIFAMYSFQRDWEKWLQIELAHFIRVSKVDLPDLIRRIAIDVNYRLTPGPPSEKVDIEILDENNAQKLAIELVPEIGTRTILQDMKINEEKIKRFNAQYRLVVGVTGSVQARYDIERDDNYTRYQGPVGSVSFWIKALPMN